MLRKWMVICARPLGRDDRPRLRPIRLDAIASVKILSVRRSVVGTCPVWGIAPDDKRVARLIPWSQRPSP